MTDATGNPVHSNPSGDLPTGPLFTFLDKPLRPGDLGSLGGYRVTKLLGEGGMGYVFRGEDDELRRAVALKVMKPEVAAKPKAKDRFKREGRAAAAIKSEHVTIIHAVGEANGVPFLAMEYLDGWTLDDWLRSRGGNAPFAAVIRVARDTLKGLASAHEKGLIHRDIKPANLWVEKPGGRVKVLDFGLTRGQGEDDRFTQSGAVVGTPAYMAPEQAAAQEVDARADLFSVGVVLYRMLSGKSPFQKETVIASLLSLTTDEPPSLSPLVPDLPKELAQFINRLMSKNPADRPRDAKMALAELGGIERRLREAATAKPTPVEVSTEQPVVVPSARMMSSPEPVLLPEPTDILAAPAVPVAEPLTRKPKRKPWLAIAGGLLGLATVIAAGVIVIKIINKDGTVTEIKAPPGSTVQVTDNGKTVAQVPPATKPTAPEVLPAKFTNALGMEFVKVPKGTAWLGGGGGKPGETKVEFKEDFYLGVYEVTQEEWEKVMGKNPSHFSRNGAGKDAVKDIQDADLKRFPVETVSWNDGQAFVERLNKRAGDTGWVYRLPTGQEWEYACRGGALSDKLDSAFDFYLAKPLKELLLEQANFAPGAGKGLQRSCKVGSYQPNQLGLYDLHGNIYEWCDDTEKAADGASHRVSRGGSWYVDSGRCRAALRDAYPPSGLSSNLGLRLARVPVAAELPAKFTNALGMEFARIPKGTAWLGGGGGKPGETKVDIPADFYLGVYEVTQEEWEKATGLKPSEFSRTGNYRDAVKDVPDADLKRLPVESVTWDECQAFCERLNKQAGETGWVYRLPTAAEWEYACRGGPLSDRIDSGFDFFFEKPSLVLNKDQANIENALKRTCKVGSYKPNALGLFDLHGNAWEWTADEAPPGPNDPQKVARRVRRGGGWNNEPIYCKAAHGVGADPPSKRNSSVGLRLARVPAGAIAPTPLPGAAAWKPVPVGQSPLDKLDAAQIPAAERFDWQPKELVAVIGSHARRHWASGQCAAITDDGKLAATHTLVEQESVVVWDAATGAAKWYLSPPRGDEHYGNLHFTPAGRKLLYFAAGILTTYDLTGPKPVPSEFDLGNKPDGTKDYQWTWSALVEQGRTLLVMGPSHFGLFDVSADKPKLLEVRQRTQNVPWPTTNGDSILYWTNQTTVRKAAIRGGKWVDDAPVPPLTEKQSWIGFTPDGKQIVSKGQDEVAFWDITGDAPKAVKRVSLKETGVFFEDVYLSPDRRWMVLAHTGFALFRIDGAEPKFHGWLHKPGLGSHYGSRCAFTTDGNRAVIVTSEGFVRFWDLSGAEPKETDPLDPTMAIADTSLDSRAGQLMVRRLDHYNRYQRWNLAAARPVPDVDIVLDTNGLGFPVAGGRWLRATGEGAAFQFFETVAGKWQPTGEAFGGPGYSYGQMSGDQTTLVGVAQTEANGIPQQRLERWDLTGKPTRTASLDLPGTFSHIGSRHLLTTSADGRWFTIPLQRRKNDQVWELLVVRATGAKLEVYASIPFDNISQGLMSVSLTADGRSLIHKTGTDRGLRLVDLSGPQLREVATFAPSERMKQANHLAFHPNGRTVAWGGYNSVGVFDVVTGQVLWEWKHFSYNLQLEWAHDGRHLIVTNGNRTVYVLRFPQFGEPIAAAFPPLDPAWVAKVKALKPDEQAKEVAEELKRRNPGLNGKPDVTIDNGMVSRFRLANEPVLTDIVPVCAFEQLADLNLDQSSSLANLAPLRGMRVEALHANHCSISDLSPLEGMPLIQVHVTANKLVDLKPLVGPKLALMSIAYNPITDLRPLREMPSLTSLSVKKILATDFSPLQGRMLTDLDVSDTEFGDLNLLAAAPLTNVLNISNTKVSDLSPLKGKSIQRLSLIGAPVKDLSVIGSMPLKQLSWEPRDAKEAALMRGIKTLETINDKPAAEFWKEYDAKKK